MTAMYHKQENCILKSNLWKFFKALRAQANPIYSLLAASPIHYAWITIYDKADTASQKRIPISLFIHNLKKIPSKDKYYSLNINLYNIGKGCHGKSTCNIIRLSELSVDMLMTLLSDIVAFHCMEARKSGGHFELTPQTIKYYKFKKRYLEELKTIVERCNAEIEIQS